MSSNATIIADVLAGYGYESHQIAGVIGNLVQESGLRPTGAVGDNGTAHGVAQWRLDRLDGLREFAAHRGSDWTD